MISARSGSFSFFFLRLFFLPIFVKLWRHYYWYEEKLWKNYKQCCGSCRLLHDLSDFSNWKKLINAGKKEKELIATLCFVGVTLYHRGVDTIHCDHRHTHRKVEICIYVWTWMKQVGTADSFVDEEWTTFSFCEHRLKGNKMLLMQRKECARHEFWEWAKQNTKAGFYRSSVHYRNKTLKGCSYCCLVPIRRN